MPQEFVILTYARTGSNWLVHCLNYHPDILCHYELYHPARIYDGWGEKSQTACSHGIFARVGRNVAPVRFFKQIVKQSAPVRAVGFKLFVVPMHNRRMFDYVMAHQEIKKILLIRKNPIKNYISLLIAQETGVWNSLTGSHQQQIQVVADYTKFLKHAEQRKQRYQTIVQTLNNEQVSYYELSYEDLIGKSETLLQIHEFLDVHRHTASVRQESKYQKQNSEDLRTSIANYGEFARSIRGTEYESYLAGSLQQEE